MSTFQYVIYCVLVLQLLICVSSQLRLKSHDEFVVFVMKKFMDLEDDIREIQLKEKD